MNAPERRASNGQEPLDVRLARIEERVTSIQEHGATKADIHGLTGEIKGLDARVAAIQEHGATKAELGGLRADIQRLESGTKTEIGGVKAEIGGVKVDIGGLKTEMGGVKADIGGLRTEIVGVRAEIRTEVKGLEARIGWWLLGVSVLVVVGLMLQIVG